MKFFLKALNMLVVFVLATTFAFAAEQEEQYKQNDYCGIIDLPTTWTKDNSPYRITGDIQISHAARLTIEAGVDVLIVPGETCGETKQLDWSDSTYVSIKVLGSLVMKGTAKEPVRILPENHIPGKIQWDGIRLIRKERAQVSIEYTHIMGANKAINASFGRFNIGNSLFIGNSTGVWLENEGDVSIYNCVFTENLSAGIYISNSRPSIAANIFYKNSNFGIWSDSRPSPRINNNIFFENADTDCRFCPVGVSKIIKSEGSYVPTDKFGNIYSDPIFAGSEKEKSMEKKDLNIPTPIKDTKDTALHKMYEKSQSIPAVKSSQANLQPFRLSKYSPAINAAPRTDFFKNADDTGGDIGLYGGKLGRYDRVMSL
jgi:parallel beta-helix repeat protein